VADELGVGFCFWPILLNFPDLVVIFLLRALITLPVIAATAYWVVF
jgi:nucleoside recognition membrane protein YjiH